MILTTPTYKAPSQVARAARASEEPSGAQVSRAVNDPEDRGSDRPLTSADVPNEVERLLVAAEVAEILSVPTTWVYAAARSGALPCIRAGRYVRFKRTDIEAWITRGGHAAVSPDL